MRLRTAAWLAGLCLLLAAEAQAQNQLSFTHITARPGEERTIPLSGTFGGGMNGLLVTVLFDPAVIQVLDVSLADLTQDFTLQSHVANGRLTIAMAAAQDILTVFPEPILDLRVRVIGSPGSVTGLDIVSTVVNEGDASSSSVDGSLTVVREASVVGWVLYFADLAGVPDVVLSATGAASVSGTTDSEGRFEIGPTAVGDYDVAIERSPGSLVAVDALDAVDVLRHLIGAITLSDDQAFVADVSGNGVIGTNDAALILRFLVGLESSFPAGDFWQFRPGALRFRPLIQDEFRNFTAFLMGDVDGSWSAGGAGKRLAAAGPALELKAAAPGADRQRGSVVITATGLEALRGGVVDLRYDPAMLRAVRADREDLGSDALLAANLQEPGRVRLAFAGTERVDGEANLVRISFEEMGASGSRTTLRLAAGRLNHEELSLAAMVAADYRLGRRRSDLTADGIVDLADLLVFADHWQRRDPRYDMNGDGIVDLVDFFIFVDGYETDQRAKALAAAADLGLPVGPILGANAPNPFNSATVIPLRLQETGSLRLRIYDLAGQRIRSLADGVWTAGEHRVRWDGRDGSGRPVASGAYIYQLQAAGRTVERKLLLLR